jgi:hypothetical protein
MNVLSLDLPQSKIYAYRSRNYSTNEKLRKPVGNSVSIGDLEEPDSPVLEEIESDPSRLYVSPRGFTWGSYVGTTVERSNYNVFLDRHGDVDGVFRTYGGHGSNGILIRADVTDSDVIEDLRSVASYYPVLDDGDHSRLEMALENFQLGLDPTYDDKRGINGWKGDALDSFRESLETRIIDVLESEPEMRRRTRNALYTNGPETGRDAIDDLIGAVNTGLENTPDDVLRDIFWKHVERGRDIIHETATGPYIDTDAVASRVKPTTFVPYTEPRNDPRLGENTTIGDSLWNQIKVEPERLEMDGPNL